MRFFKSFALLHRRTKSDPLLSSAPPATPAQKPTSLNTHLQPDDPSNTTSGLFFPPSRPTTHMAAVNLRIFDLQVENARLRHVACITSAELAQAKAQLHATQLELLVELHRSARNIKAYSCEIERLHSALAHENRLPTISEHRARGPDPQDTLPTVNALGQNPVSTSRSVTSLLSLEASYLSSLRMTLETRKDLKECKKVAKFWKCVAQQENPASKVVTPSSSNLSSVYEPLSAVRQSAVDLLIAKRHRENVERLDPEQSSISISGSLMQPCASLQPLRFDLPVLASQSFRQEMASISSKALLLERSTTLQNLMMRVPSLAYLRKGKPRRSVSWALDKKKTHEQIYAEELAKVLMHPPDRATLPSSSFEYTDTSTTARFIGKCHPEKNLHTILPAARLSQNGSTTLDTKSRLPIPLFHSSKKISTAASELRMYNGAAATRKPKILLTRLPIPSRNINRDNRE